MAFDTNSLRQARPGVETNAAIDAGLRSYMLSVYNYMASGVALTGIVALFTASSPAMLNMIYGSGLGMVIMFAPLAFILVMNFGLNKMSATTLQGVFWAFCAVMGLSLSSIFLMYTGGSVAKVFFISAGSFAGLSLWGYTTKKDLTGWGSFLIMGLVGLILTSIVNMIWPGTVSEVAISLIGVGLFAALTAYDTQMIKNMYYEGDGSETRTKKIVMGAVRLYLDFINLFLMLLRLLGNRN